MSKLTIVIILGLIIFIAWSMGILPGAEVVGGKTAYVRLEVDSSGYDEVYGLKIITTQSSGVYKNYETDWVGAYIAPKMYTVGWTEDNCKKSGGTWIIDGCHISSNPFAAMGGVENLEVTKSELSLCGGWCVNSWLTTCGANFGTIEKDDIILKDGGIWFRGIEEDMDKFNRAQKEVARKNCQMQLNGAFWVKVSEVCEPEWQCTGWSPCTEANLQTRSCTDVNDCGTLVGKPIESQFCVYVPEPYCGDSVCQQNEDCAICPQDCGVCVDEDENGVIIPEPTNVFEWIIQSINNFIGWIFSLFGG